MNAIIACAVIFAIFAIGDIISVKTKAIVSMLLVASVVFLAGFWTGLFPASLFADSTLLSVAGIFVTILLVHLGTIIKLKDFGAQWRTVIVSAVACVAISAGVYFLGSVIIERGFALAGAPILSGGVVATLLMTDMATKAGRADLAVFATLVMCTQCFVGYPVASLCLKSEAKRLKKKIDSGLIDPSAIENCQEGAVTRKKLIPPIPDKYNSPNVILAKVVIVALFSTWIAGLFNNSINKLVWCLVFGVLAKELGILEEDALGKANATGILMPIITLTIFTNLASATPEMVRSMIVPLLVVVLIGIVCFTTTSILIGKVFHYSWQMSVAIGSSCLFGFPGTFIISNEAVGSTAENDAERQYLSDRIMPKMLIAGMVTVSITSVLLAGVMSNWL